MKSALQNLIPPIAVFACVLLVWHFAAQQSTPLVLPAPAAVWKAAVERSDLFLQAAWITGAAALCGLGSSIITGTLVAFAFSQSRHIRSAFYPYAIFLQTVPIVAIAPLVIIWFGHGFHSVVIVSFIISLFPIITNTTTGLLQVDSNLQDLFRLHDASWLQMLLKLRLPAAVPYLIAGIRISAAIAVVGAIVGEFFVGFQADNFGLGYLIRTKNTEMKIDQLFAAVIASTLLGVIVFTVVTVTGNWILNRWYSETGSNAN